MEDQNAMNELLSDLAQNPELLEDFLRDPEAVLKSRAVSDEVRAELLRGGAWNAACSTILEGELRPRWAGEPVRIISAKPNRREVTVGEDVRIELRGVHLEAGRTFVHLERQAALGSWCRPIALSADIESVATGASVYDSVVIANCTIPEAAQPGTYLLHVTGVPKEMTSQTEAERVSYDIVNNFIEVIAKS